MKVLAFTLTFAISALLGWIFPREPTQPESRNPESETKRLTDSGKPKAAQKIQATLHEIEKLETYSDQALFTIALASSIPIEELERWLSSEALQSLDARLAHLFREIASQRWIEASPREYLKWATLHHLVSLNDNLPHVALRDPELAIEFIGRNSSFSVPRLIHQLLTLDSDLALRLAEAHLAKHPDPHFPDHEASLLFALAKKDLAASLRILEKQPENRKKNIATGIFSVLLKQDFQEGLDFFQKQNLSVENLFSVLSADTSGETSKLLIKHHKDLPEGLLEKLFNSHELGFQISGFLPLIEVPREELNISEKAFLNFCDQLNDSNHHHYSVDNSITMNLVNSPHVPLETRRNFLQNKITRWPAWDSEGLRSWLGTLEEEQLFEQADQALKEIDAKASPDFREVYSPVERFRKIISGEEKNSFSSGFWTPEEMREIKSTFHQLTPDEKERSLDFFASGNKLDGLPLDFSSLLLSEALINRNSDSSEILIQELDSFISNWAGFKPASTAAWVATLPDGPEKLTAAREVARVWAEYDPDEARTWVETFPKEDQAEILPR